MPQHLPILFIGDADHPEFRETADWLDTHNAVTARDIDEALALVHNGLDPAVVVVAQPWPGHFSSSQIHRLCQAAPLARFVGLLGTWLEGEARTGKPWPAIWRTYWHQWLPRHVPSLEQLASSIEHPAWSLPVTASDAERLEALCRDPTNQPSESVRPTIALCSRSRETAESLADVCRQRRWQWIWPCDFQRLSPAEMDVALFDARNLVASEIDEIAAIQTWLPDTPLVVLLGFPRVEQVEQLKALGVTAIVSKPFLLTELVWQVERALTRTPGATYRNS